MDLTIDKDLFELEPYEPDLFDDDFDEFFDMTDPFDREDFLKSKRFFRYLKKSENLVIEYFSRFLEPTDPKFDNISIFIRDFIINKHYKKLIPGGETLIDFFPMYKPLKIPFKDTEIEEKIFEKLKDLHINYLPWFEDNDAIWNEFAMVMESFLYRKRASLNMEITQNNFMTYTLPSSHYEIVSIVRELFSRVYADIYIFYPYYFYLNENVEETHLQKLHSEIEEMKKENQQLQNTIMKKEEEITHLKNRLVIIDNNNEDRIKRISQENQQEIRNLNNKYNKLESKYNSLKERYKQKTVLPDSENDKPEPNLEEINTEMPSNNIDMEGRYVFVVEPTHRRCNTLKEFFPNAQFVEGEQKLGNVDCVIFMTKQMAHHGFQAMKEQCKKRGIPYRYCPNTNLEIIKEQIAIALTSQEGKE